MASSETVRFVLAMVMLLGASVSDLRTRRVPNLYWIPFLVVALLLDGAALLAPNSSGFGDLGPSTLLLAGALCGMFWLMFQARFFGGADAKALIVLSLLLPVPHGELLPLPRSLDALLNGSMLTLAYPLFFLAANLARGRLAMPAALLGIPMPLERARRLKVWPLQRIDDEGLLRWRYWPQIGRDLEDDYRRLEHAGLRTIWVTPKIPLLVPVTLGLAASWWWGNLPLRAAMWLATA